MSDTKRLLDSLFTTLLPTKRQRFAPIEWVRMTVKVIPNWRSYPVGTTVAVSEKEVTIGLRADGVVIWRPEGVTAK